MKTQELINQYAKVTCADCGEDYPVEHVNNDSVRFFLNGQMINFGPNTTQAKLDSLSLFCECCEDDRIEKEEEF